MPVGHDILVVFDHLDKVGDIHVGITVDVQVGNPNVHGVVCLRDTQRFCLICKVPVTEISQERIPAKIIGYNDVLPTVTVKIGVRDGLGPSGVGRSTALGHVFETHVAAVVK